MSPDRSPKIRHLHAIPGHRRAVADLIHQEFWQDVPGATVASMARRLRLARGRGGMPMCRVALRAGQPVGVANLVPSDADDHPEWTPWLAGVVVRADCRGMGIGSRLVKAVLADARAQGVARVYFGTDGPGFYQRLGAVVQTQVRADFWYMRFDLAPA